MKVFASAVVNDIPHLVVDTILPTDMIQYRSVILSINGDSNYCTGVDCEDCAVRFSNCESFSVMINTKEFNELFPTLKTDHPELFI